MGMKSIVATTAALSILLEDGIDSVIAIGSSMTLKSLDGRCVGDNLGTGANVYNLAHSASKPYTDMQHIPRIISSNPEIVMIEISPDILTSPTATSSIEYIELRYKIDSLYQDESDIGDWIKLVPKEYQKWIATNEFERLQFRQEYFPAAIDEYLKRILLNETLGTESGNFGWVPMPNDDEWIEYLQTPIFPNDKFGIEGFDDEKMNVLLNPLDRKTNDPSGVARIARYYQEIAINATTSGVNVVTDQPNVVTPFNFER